MIIRQKGDVVELKGSLDANQWPALKSVVNLELKNHPTGIVIDGSGLSEITEAGALTFLDAAEYIQAQNARVFLAGLSDEILEQIRRTPGVRSQLPIASSIEEARASLAVGDVSVVTESVRRPAVLVPLLGEWRRAIEYAVGQVGRKAEVHLLYVLEVPRSLPLGVPIPEQEREATQALDEAEKMLTSHGIATRRMISRARVSVDGVAKFASDTRPRAVIAAFAKNQLQMDTDAQDVVAALCEDAPGSVLIYIVVPPTETATSTCKPTILVPLVGAWTEAVQFAAEQASATKQDIHLLYVIQVPRVSPLDVEMPERETEAHQTIAEAKRILKKPGVNVSDSVVRARDIMEGVGRFAAEKSPQLVAVAYYREDLIERGMRFPVVTSLCTDAPCDVALLCPHHD